MLILSRFNKWEAFHFGCCALLICSHCFLSTSLLSGLIRCSWFTLYLFLYYFWNQPFLLGGLVSFNGEWQWISRFGHKMYWLLLWLCFLALSEIRATKYMHVYTHIHIYACKYDKCLHLTCVQYLHTHMNINLHVFQKLCVHSKSFHFDSFSQTFFFLPYHIQYMFSNFL